MYCRNCGKEIDDKAVICVHCGVPTDNMSYSGNAPVKQPGKTNGLAIAGMIVSIIGAMGGNYFFCIPSLVGLILSIVGFNKVKECNSGKGFAIAGIIVGAISLFFWAMIWIVALIGVLSIGGTGAPIVI